MELYLIYCKFNHHYNLNSTSIILVNKYKLYPKPTEDVHEKFLRVIFYIVKILSFNGLL